MPRNRDMHLYHALQAKLTQQEVDYQNMHTHSTIVRGDHGKVTKIDGDQYHPDMQLKQFEHGGATHKHYASGDFKPAKSERAPSQATPAAFVAQGTMGTGPPSREGTMRDGRSLVTLPALPTANQDERVWFSEDRQATRANLRKHAPNQNASVDLIDMEVDFGDAEEKKPKYVANIAERVKKRHAEKRRAKHTHTQSQSATEARREKGAKEKKSERQLRFEQRRKKSNETVLRERKRKTNPAAKKRSTMEY